MPSPKSLAKTAFRPSKPMAARALSPSERARCLKGFLHFSGKTVHSSVSDVSIRLPANQPRPELPYVALSTLGARLDDLDYTEGGAGFVRTPRQIKDLMTGTDSGVAWDVSGLSPTDLADLSPGGAFAQEVSAAHAHLPGSVPALLRQVIVQHEGRDISLTPIGAVALNRIILDRLNAERARRATVDRTLDRTFWGRAENILGGKKPQNIGLVCAVNGGPAAAGFAWHFKSPATPSVVVRRRWATLFRRFHYSLSADQAKALRLVLRNLGESEQASFRQQAQDVLKELLEGVRNAAQDWRTSFLDQLVRDFGASSPSGLLDRLVEQDFPERHREQWQFVARRLTSDRLYAGWLLPDAPSGWTREAGAELVRGWLRQLQVPLSPAHEKFLIQEVSRGIV